MTAIARTATKDAAAQVAAKPTKKRAPSVRRRSPTEAQFGALQLAFNHFNRHLFGRKLPKCLLTVQRDNAKALGYFWANKWGQFDANAETPEEGEGFVDEIALLGVHFRRRTIKDTLSTLVHEMVHLQQQHFGTPPQRAYHNAEWAKMMHAVGLHPSTTGEKGGKETGANCSHYVVEGGAFDRACDDLLKSDFQLPLFEVERNVSAAKKKRASKTKYSCPCCETNAWAKPETKLICGECEEVMEAEERDEA